MNIFTQRFTSTGAAIKSCLALGLFSLSAYAFAHKASDAYISVESSETSTTQLSIALALRDIDLAVETLDADNNREITWAEVQTAGNAIASWLSQDIQMQCDRQKVNVSWQTSVMQARSDGPYLSLATTVQCNQGAKLSLNYRLFKNLDSNHRAIVSGQVNKQDFVAVLGGGAGDSIELRAASHFSDVFLQFIPTGIYHIATGWDHLAFLLALLLPMSVLINKAKIFRTVTGFTIGHSVTLAFASFGIIGQLNWIEPVIALSVGATALLNLRSKPFMHSAEGLALGFGLIHGLGFSSIMRDANLSSSLLPWALAGFNFGVELGQLASVIVWAITSYCISGWRHYGKVVIRGGSGALLMLSIYWFTQRVSG